MAKDRENALLNFIREQPYLVFTIAVIVCYTVIEMTAIIVLHHTVNF